MKKQAAKPQLTPLHVSMLPRIQIAFLAAYALYLIIFDSGNVLTREAVYHRWMLFSALLLLTAVYWVATKKWNARVQLIVWMLLIAGQLATAGLTTYWERGMASMSTVLYALPILSAALYASRTYTIGTAMAAVAVYAGACTKYFYDFFNEGYRVQLYGQIFFFCAVFMVLGWTAGSLAHRAHKAR